MNNSEITIRNLLSRESQPQAIKQALLTLLDPQVSLAEKKSYANFIIHSGALASFVRQSLNLLKRRELPFPRQLLQTLGLANVIDSAAIEKIIHGAKELGHLDDLALGTELARLHPKLQEIRAHYQQQLITTHKERRQKLKEQLEFYRQNRVIEKEKEVLLELKRLFPVEPERTVEEKDYKDRWAREVLNRAGLENSTRNKKINTRQAPSKKEVVFLSQLLAFALETARKSPQKAYDLALLFHFLDFPRQALQICELSPPSPSSDWLQLELMLAGGLYVRALDALDRLSQRYGQDPEVIFALTYSRALALWGLGHGNDAIKTLQSILEIRPSYRAAESLLAEWAEMT